MSATRFLATCAVVAAVSAVVATGALRITGPAPTAAGDDHKVTICHHTGSDSHPFETIEVDEHAVDAQGRVEFPITLPPDRVGFIDVPVEVVRASSVEARSMRFLVAWRAQTDLSKLGDDPPKIHIVFHVMRGSSLWIAGQQIRVSGETGIAELAGPPPSPAGEGDARRERYPVRDRKSVV